MNTVWTLIGAVNTAAMIRAYRPQFCRLLWEEFGPKAPRASYSHSARADGSNKAAPACRPALLGAAARPSLRPTTLPGAGTAHYIKDAA